ncbi:MAG TPA: ADYC domain-containing protein [Kofleriaceae bacterium]
MSRASLFALACGGCLLPEPEPALETLSQAALMDDGCPPKECGTNSTAIDGVYFYEVNRNGLVNSEGVSIIGYQGLPAGAVRLDARKNELVARDAFDNVVASGPSLIGSGFTLDVNGTVHLLRIIDFHRSLRYHAFDDGTALMSYTFAYPVVTPMGTTWKPLCTVEDLADGAASLDALVFEGDRYDPVTRKVTTGAVTKGWFNLACLGGGPAKNHRMRATTASSDPLNGITTPLSQRQALFNVWSANYCGDGKPFTVPGEPLRIRDRAKGIPLTSGWSWEDEAQLDSHEALWGPDGAICLDTPRREDSAPGFRTLIADHCKSVGHELPYCSELDGAPPTWLPGSTYWTANPIGS